jgi:hypothetical protein
VEKDFAVKNTFLQYWPIYKPTLRARIVAKMRAKLSIDTKPTRNEPENLNWDVFSKELTFGIPAHLARLARPAYQILECSPR